MATVIRSYRDGSAAKTDVCQNGAQLSARPHIPLEPGLHGFAQVHAHHGEVLQGVFQTSDRRLEHGLVTMPCKLYCTRARFRAVRSGPLLVIPADRSKARSAARLLLDALGCTGWGGVIVIDSNVPLSQGCGSSTTDVVATLKSIADAFRIALPPEWLAQLAVSAETASDPLMFSPTESMLFAQRTGVRLLSLGGPLPTVYVLGLNVDLEGRGLDTLAIPQCRYSWWEVEAFRPLLGLLRNAVENGDPQLLGRVANASAEISQRHRPKPLMLEVSKIAQASSALGIQVAHSGTVMGVLFEPERNMEDRIQHARVKLCHLGIRRTWLFSTDFGGGEGSSPSLDGRGRC